MGGETADIVVVKNYVMFPCPKPTVTGIQPHLSTEN